MTQPRNHTMKTMMLSIAATLMLALLAACGTANPPAATAAPTQDLNALRTEVAATVLAQCAQSCALTPLATFAATNTPQPTATEAGTATATVDPTSGTGTILTGTPGSATGDQAKWVSQSIQDGTRFAPNEAFNMTWTLRNVGVTTWTDGYRLRFYSGNVMGAPNEIALDRDVAPNETIDITINMRAPATAGRYRTDWVMSTETLYNFNEPVFLEIVVGNPPTSTVTATLAPTSTSTPQELAPSATSTP